MHIMNRKGERTLVVINSHRIPLQDCCIHVLATGQASDKYEGPTQKEISATQRLVEIIT